MSRHTNDECDWQFMYLVKDTRPFPEAMWGCVCGTSKKVQMLEHGHPKHPNHPDQRYRYRKQMEEIEV